jgi:ribosomal protein L30E
MSVEAQLKRAYGTGKLVLGEKNTEKDLLNGKLKGVCFSKDLNSIKKERLLYFLKVAKLPYFELLYSPKDVGELIGVDYPVNALGIEDEGKASLLQELK